MLFPNQNEGIHENEKLILLKKGNEKAFDDIYKKYGLYVYRNIFQMVKMENVAEELTQEIFIKIWETKDLIDPEKPFVPYLIKIISNKVIDFFRKTTRDNKLKKELLQACVQITDCPEKSILKKEVDAIVQNAIQNLPSKQQIVFYLCKIEGRTYEETARVMGISIATVNNHIVKATKSIKTYLNRNYFPIIILLSFCQLIFFSVI
ncbi:MAG: RNA polymerase sigma-70 factor [Arachidicoccus sp.]|nr:RNA polymerase sigma-70 factor [Arachidicoccus sp.]